MAQRISRAKRAPAGEPPGPARRTLRRRAAACSTLVYTAGHRGAGWTWPARRSGSPRQTHPRHRGTGGARAARADAPQPRPASRRDSTQEGPYRHARTGRTRGPCLGTTARSPRVVRVPCKSALGRFSPPGRYQAEAAQSPPLHGRPRGKAPGRPTGPQILPPWYDDLVALTDDPVRQDPRTQCRVLLFALRDRCLLRSRTATSSARRTHGYCARPTGPAARVIGERHRWHAVRRPPARAGRRPPCRRHGRTPRPPAPNRATNVRPRARTTWVRQARSAARGRRAMQGTARLTERPP